ncbi:S-adenosyl methyltransferase [Haloactinospora alba]|uniref:S-adenosyl methyltransferase n=1 Tax=Haloactinospora alba TaxID=405555 RepID=A0A543NJ24_9ACTN|nr:SAM-dependent methyltransferase [Haloactinospora alba]TQN31845.1 S-adenosyl methyltransferase [Haloactinospora alba]
MTETPPSVDTSVAHVARIWNYWLGGKDNYAADRETGDEIARVVPEVRELANAARAFLGRAVRYLAGEAGVRQFLDIGTGMPTVNNTHEVAQAVAPESRVVYVDNDPLVLAHANALLVGTEEGSTDYIHADLRDPATIIEAARRRLDLTRPVALMLMGVLEFVTDDDEARGIVRQLLEALPAGSYLALYDGSYVIYEERSAEMARMWNESGNTPLVLRSPEQLAGFFEGTELVDPGVVSVSQWRPDPTHIGSPREVDAFCGVARKPHA